MAHWQWQIGNDKLAMGKLTMANGQWIMRKGQWARANGQGQVVNEQMMNGIWPLAHGHRAN